ncbi:MAG: peptidoglycan bridge formation glycyltransferase FemA/FemB family protein [candidate division NC10 bacterium]|nr:peptidoglycan bridge formation glycyltransferase FemA/FemB family protein [candidate division NC10 bacterium]
MEVKEVQERSQWNQYMLRSPKGHILQSFEWGELKARTGWTPLRLAVVDGGEFRAGISLLKRRIPGSLGRTILYAPRGPVADFADREALSFLFEDLKLRAPTHRAILLKVDPAVTAEEEGGTLSTLGLSRASGFEAFGGVQPQCVFRLDLGPSLEGLLQRMEPKTRYNIRLAAKKGVEVEGDCHRDDLKTFYGLLVETAIRDGFLIRSYNYFEGIWEELVGYGLGRLFLARYKGEVIAGTLALIFGDKCWYIYGASSNRHRNLMPNHALQWEMIKWAKSQGCIWYDFRAVPCDPHPGHPLSGLYRFKKGFGARFYRFVGEYDLVFSPFDLWIWDLAQGLHRRLKGILRFWESMGPRPSSEEGP